MAVLLPTAVIQCSANGAECAGELRWREFREHAANDVLVYLDPEGLSDLLGDADVTGAKERRKGDQQVDDKDEDFSHRANRCAPQTLGL